MNLRSVPPREDIQLLVLIQDEFSLTLFGGTVVGGLQVEVEERT